MRVLCVLLPHFPLRCEVLRHPAIKQCSAIITYAVGSQKLVLDYAPELEGLQRDMPLQQALSRYGEVELIHADVPYYYAVFNEILDALEEKSPVVEGSDLGNAYIGINGLQLIYKNDNAVVNSIREAIPEAFIIQMGIAEGKFLAYLAATTSPPGGYSILTDNVNAFIKDLSCDVLPISAKSKCKLLDFGIRTLGQVATLLPGPIQAQFGPEGRRIYKLAMGHDDTPLHPRFMEEIIEERTILSSVTTSLEALLITVETLLSRAFSRDSIKGRGICSVTMWTRSLGAVHWEKSIRFKEPAIDIKCVISRIKKLLESSPQPGPVEQMGVKLTRLGYHRGKQKSIFSEVRAKDHLMEDIKQLELRLDSPQVFMIKEVEPWSRMPERRYALAPINQ